MGTGVKMSENYTFNNLHFRTSITAHRISYQILPLPHVNHFVIFKMSAWGRRVCCACGKDLDSDEFSRNQWSKGVGFSRCTLCIEEGATADSDGFDPGRRNNATRLEVDLEDIFAMGSFKYCALGRYTGGMRTGQKLVAKWFKEDNHFEDEFFARDLSAVDQTLRIITQWNQAGFVPGVTIRLNIPEIWSVDGRQCMIEPFIADFTKFNSNTGWVRRGKHNHILLLLQALSHYSYHVSSGQFVLCDLQGGYNRDVITLTDPAVLSRRQKFGPADLGPKGMSSFFYHHR